MKRALPLLVLAGLIIAFVPKAAQSLAGLSKTPDPIGIAETAHTERELRQSEVPWIRRALVEPCAKRRATSPKLKETLEWLDKVIAATVDDSIDAQCPQLLAEANLGFDLLVVYLVTEMQREACGESSHTWRVLNNLCSALPKTPERGGLAWSVARARLEASGDNPYPAHVDEAMTWLKEAWHDGTYSKDDWSLFVRQLLRGDTEWFKVGGDKLIETVAALDPPEWVRATLTGYVEVKKAWLSRGNGWGSEVTKDGWRGFSEHLALARKALTRAWELKPDEPHAAAKLISVAMGESSGDARLWLDRARAAVADHRFALRSYVYTLMPRWGGSNQAMVDFAWSCLRADRYDTGLPIIAPFTLNQMNMDAADLRAVYSHPLVKPLVLEFSRKLAEEPSRIQERDMRHSFLAVNAWLAGEYELAAATLKQSPSGLHPLVRQKLATAYADERSMRGELALRAIVGGPAAWDGYAAAYEKGDLERTAVALRAVRPSITDPLAADFADGQLAVVETERKLASGDWVEVPFAHALQGWGTWPERSPRHKTARHRGRVVSIS